MKRSIFEDNDLVDWLIELGESSNASGFITRSVKRVQRELAEEEYVDSLPAGIVLGLGETFAALRGRWSPSLPADVLEKLGRMRKRDWEPMVAEYLKLLDRVEQQCEIKELWEEGGFGADWASAISDLRFRLVSPPEQVEQARKKRVRYQTGDIFAIPLPDGTDVYGSVVNHKSVLVKVFDRTKSLDAVLVRGNLPSEGFTVSIEEDLLKNGSWPIVSRASIANEPEKSITFHQSHCHFRRLINYQGRPASAKECFMLEYGARWDGDSIVERIVNGMSSPKLARYWPRCVNAEGELVPKWWSHWTEEDFAKMEHLASTTPLPPLW